MATQFGLFVSWMRRANSSDPLAYKPHRMREADIRRGYKGNKRIGDMLLEFPSLRWAP